MKALKSIGAVIAGFVTIFILSVVTDMIVEKLGILPPATQPQDYLWWHLLIALAYRTIFAILGGWVTARLAPSKPVKHALALAIIGTIFGGLGTFANWSLAIQSGVWYPIVLLISSPFAVWYGAKLHVKQ